MRIALAGRRGWLLSVLLLAVSPQGSTDVASTLDGLADETVALAEEIWEHAELGYLETRSTQRLQSYLEDNGFHVRAGVADIPTAFVAQYGKGSPVIGIMAEFDALPGLSQKALPHEAARIEGAAGHACGHHLFGAASASAGVAVAEWLKTEKRRGTVRVYGTPAEEGGSGKVYMTRTGLFDDVDVMLHWHPSDRNDASAYSTTSNKSGRFRFYGVAAHAAGAPHQGRSALDGVEAMNFMVNLMREHVPQESRIHYVITDGGDAPNIVPRFAEVYYYVRHPKVEMVKKLFERVVTAAEAGALGTSTRMDYEVMHGNYPVLPNETLAAVVDGHLRALGGISYTDAEREFAEQIRETAGVNTGFALESASEVQPFALGQRMGSTDVGDVSWLVPTVGFGTATWVPGTSAHSWQAVAAGGMSIGHKGMMLAARLLAVTAVDLYKDADLIRRARDEFEDRRGTDFEYEALLGDRDPPLDYRL
ncbi:MAG: amidohydrolase [Pseudomonadales bacterium]|nr:amidohydrolase [Pseudomonadales bacterium]MDP6471865.1 amidohydrolase [Pseudomonadales bacterium]MDP6826865.1 amidohydrolase [Pseudomonadales bacterium]MDP6970857.1 amidohydrolase [Pseudomonadales bacterium]